MKVFVFLLFFIVFIATILGLFLKIVFFNQYAFYSVVAILGYSISKKIVRFKNYYKLLKIYENFKKTNRNNGKTNS